MLKVERHSQILKYLENNNVLSIAKIAEMLNCSEETIRKDLIELEMQNKLVRTWGGAYLKNPYDRGFGNFIKKDLMIAEKNQIANNALKFVKSNDVILIDSSTTCIELIKKIISMEVYLTVISNSLDVANICAGSKYIKLITVGGELHKQTNSFVGYQAIDFIKKYRCDTSFLSYPTIDYGFGFGDNNLENLKIRQTMLEHSKNHVVLLDHTKFEDDSALVFSKIENIDCIITDQKPSEKWINYLVEKKIDLIY